MQNAIAREALNKQQNELRARIAGIEKDLRTRRLSRKSHQQNIERANDDVLGALEDEALFELQQTNAALQRLTEGEYGFCLECGEEISDARLSVLPHTEFCRSCAEYANTGFKHH